MLYSVFMKVLEMSMVGCYSILVVLAARLLLRKCPRKYSYYLWFVVFLNLCLPVTFEGIFSLIPRQVAGFSVEEDLLERYRPAAEALVQEKEEIEPEQVMENPHPDMPAREREEEKGDGAETGGKLPVFWMAAGWVWLSGVCILGGYYLAGFFRLRNKIRKAKVFSWDGERRIATVDFAQSAFLYGFFIPIAYLPANLSELERTYVTAHELYHRQRRDYLVKPAALCVTVLHWFNPLVWLAFGLFCQDMEVSCDEKVLDHTTGSVRKQYAASLLKFAARESGFLLITPRFGKPALRDRIRNVLREKKKSLFLTAFAAAGVLFVVFGLTIRPLGEEAHGDFQGEKVRVSENLGGSQEEDESLGGSEREDVSLGGSEGEDESLEWYDDWKLGRPCVPQEAGWDLSQVEDLRDEEAFRSLDLQNIDKDRVFLLAITEHYSVYGKGDYENILVEKEGNYAQLPFPFVSNYMIPVKVMESDLDGDGETELAIQLNVLHGTGIYVDSLFVADENAAGELWVYQFLEKDYCAMLREHLGFEQTRDGTQPLVDGKSAGLPLFYEEGVPYDFIEVGDQILFDISQESIGLNAEISFWMNDAAVADYCEDYVSAWVRYRDGGSFSLEGIYGWNANAAEMLHGLDEEVLPDMIRTVPPFESTGDWNEAFWEDFVFYSYTNVSDWEEGADVRRVYREDIGWEEQRIVPLKEVEERTRQLLGAELPADFRPRKEDMPAGRTALYYEDDCFYVGASDAPDTEYVMVSCFTYEEKTAVQYRRVYWGEDEGYVLLLLEPADNANGFILTGLINSPDRIYEMH